MGGLVVGASRHPSVAILVSSDPLECCLLGPQAPFTHSFPATFSDVMNMESDLRYLFEEKGVLTEDVEKLVTMGGTSMSRLSLLDDSRAGARSSITKIIGLDPDTAEGRGRLISILDA